MENVYDRIDALCKDRRVSGAKMCLDLGMSKSFMTELRKGRAKSIKVETAAKIAEYFHVSVDYLLGTEQKEKPAKSASLKREDIKFAVFGDPSVDDDLMDDVMALAKTMMEQRKKKGK